jgi:hypothetical protein
MRWIALPAITSMRAWQISRCFVESIRIELNTSFHVVFVVDHVVVQSLLVLIAIAVSVHLVRLPTYQPTPG